MTNITLILIAVTLTTAASQTFQYSRGWTNGKRDHKRSDNALSQILSPCQLQKLKFLLQGKPLTDRLLIPCDYGDDSEPKLFTAGQDSLSDTFQ